MKSFFLNGKEYLLDYGYDGSRTFHLWRKSEDGLVDLHRDQKRFLIMKLQEMIHLDPNLNIDTALKDEIMSYSPGHVSRMKSNELAKLLYGVLN